MKRLAAIRARRRELLLDVDAGRRGACVALARVRQWLAPVSIGIAAGQAIAGRGWLRIAALASAALLLVRRARQP